MKSSSNLNINYQRLLRQPFNVALLLNAKLVTHSQILRGFSAYMKENQLNWSITLNHEIQHRRGDDVSLWFDGFVADYNHPAHRALLESLDEKDAKVVGILNGIDYIKDSFKHPTIVLDNVNLMSIAHDFLTAKGLKNIACYGLHDDDQNLWQKTRLATYFKKQLQSSEKSIIYRGSKSSFSSWMEEASNLAYWLEGLPKPCGIIVTSDLRARTLISICLSNKIIVPDEISVLSIGDVEPSELFHDISLSVVDPNYYQMGWLAADNLNRQISDRGVPSITWVEPSAVKEGSSTDFRSVVDPDVLRALYYVRKNFSKGIKVQQVVDFAGCSRSTLETKFKSLVGHALHLEIHNQKMNHVKMLLLTTEDSIAEVAKASGFPSTQYLYGLFKKELNITPSEFRLQGQVGS